MTLHELGARHTAVGYVADRRGGASARWTRHGGDAADDFATSQPRKTRVRIVDDDLQFNRVAFDQASHDRAEPGVERVRVDADGQRHDAAAADTVREDLPESVGLEATHGGR